MKSYKEYTKSYIGESDIAALVLIGLSEKRDLTASFLRFGGDGSYSAYVVDREACIPDHYTLAASFRYWLKVYDDTTLTMRLSADRINIYRAGQYGVLIQCINDD